MEQKKTLWIALSSGIFLLVVLGAAVIIYAPGAKTNASALAMRESGQVWTAGLPNQAASQGALIATVPDSGLISGSYSPASSSASGTGVPLQDGVVKADNMTVYTENTTLYTMGDISTGASSQAALSSAAGGSVSPNVSGTNLKSEQIIQETGNKKKVEEPKQAVPSSQSSAVAKSPAPSGAKSSSASSSTSTASSSAAAKASSGTSTASSPAAAKASAGTAAAKTPGAAAGGSPAAKQAILPAAHYWVQVASYSSKDNADEARNVLDAKDLPCEVFTFTKDSKLYYRVRVGPYKTESEAERWKKSIDAIDLFKTAQSYVVDSSARASR